MSKRGCGIIFYNPKDKAVLLFRRDDKPGIPFPDMLDLLGGHVEEGEDPAQAAVREMYEELLDLRTNRPYVLQGHEPFLVYTDKRGCKQHIFTCVVDFNIEDVRLEGRELVWLSESHLNLGVSMAFEFDDVLREFFARKRETELKSHFGIAIEIIKWRWRQLGTERFMGELKAVVADTDISDDAMFEFFEILSKEMNK